MYSMNSELHNKRKNKMMSRRRVRQQKLKKKLKCKNRWQKWISMDTSQSMAKTQQCLIKCTWTTYNSFRVTTYQMLLQLNLFHPKFLKDHTVSKAHKMEPMQTIDKMMKKVSPQVWLLNQSLKETKQWLTFQHVISQNFLLIWEVNMETHSSTKDLKLSSRIELCYTRTKASKNLFRCLTIWNSQIPIRSMDSLTSAQHIWLFKTCNVEPLKVNINNFIPGLVRYLDLNWIKYI